MRTNMPSFGVRTPFTENHFTDFIKAFGKNPYGKSPRKDQGEEGRFRCFTREEIMKRNENLDISWLHDDSNGRAEDLPEPEVIAAEIMENLKVAMGEMEKMETLLANSSKL